MKLSYKSGGNFEPCPEYTGRAVCVDVTPLQHQQSQYGDRQVFKLVFEVEEKREDGTPFCVWSRPYTPSLNEKANLRKDLRKWMGRDLNAQELQEFDTESLLGKPAFVIVTHSEGNNGETYANIDAILPHKEMHGSPLQPSGKYVRKKDREDKQSSSENGKGAAYRSAEKVKDSDTGESAGRVDWMTTEVHVGKHAGVQLGDLDADAVEALLKHWMPAYTQLEKPKAADKRLASALEQAKEALAEATTEETPY
tara:strand:+ start:13670 stop:14428 length:759 start_codon:yes stop_codon:yes gene_type:complete